MNDLWKNLKFPSQIKCLGEKQKIKKKKNTQVWNNPKQNDSTFNSMHLDFKQKFTATGRFI